MADISDWLTYPQAAKLTGIAKRTLERRVAEGRLIVASRRGGGRKPMTVLDPHGLQQLVAEESKALQLIRSEPQQIAPITPPSPLQDHASIPPVVQPASNAPPPPQEIVLRRASRSRYVTLPEARDYIGLPVAYLERMIKSGALPAIKAGKWFVRTADLDRL
jgi:hypothetical protein